jgi:hypothetical protein
MLSHKKWIGGLAFEARRPLLETVDVITKHNSILFVSLCALVFLCLAGLPPPNGFLFSGPPFPVRLPGDDQTTVLSEIANGR